MIVRRHLSFHGSPANLQAFISETERSLDEGWSRDRELEVRLASRTGMASFCFVCEKSGDRENGHLHVFPRRDDLLEVMNIIPSKEKEQLSIAEYNRILIDFHDRFARGIAARHGVQVRLSSSEYVSPNWAGDNTFERIKRHLLGRVRPISRVVTGVVPRPRGS